MFNRKIQAIAESKSFDFLGVAIVLTTVFMLGYYKTPLSASWVFAGHDNFFLSWPLIGVVSTLSAIASIMATRLTAKVSNWGNVVSWINTIFSGTIDFLLGNVGAVLTYPLSVYLNWQASQTWAKKYRHSFGRQKNFPLFLAAIMVGAVIVGFGLNYIAYVGLAHEEINSLYYFSSITFTFSLIANVLNVFKLPSQWTFWAIYNVAQLGKAFSLGNFANVAKYIYYIINSIFASFSWLLKKERLVSASEE
ncbi:nicotinamide mononucleotide transporter [Fructobacillus ficulneus]|uniref:Nicotinamide mononucleotide transporter n=1 Tax=Fructobacillus ficulneus TaxID=157463 RepID=A0A0K8MIS2_9LACO|nr:nicotinamide mononucleotide transporter [Fructobacillus ficulneus]GAP00363.1 hypothetical protein FFIC_283800 [Fructobacillus ficulneus]